MRDEFHVTPIAAVRGIVAGNPSIAQHFEAVGEAK